MKGLKNLPESFTVDHRLMSAPQVRIAGEMTGPLGDKITKFDLRFVKPNTEFIPSAAIHTLEHLMATYIRGHLDGVIDLSPMGCRTGFYLSVWGKVTTQTIAIALIKTLKQVLECQWEDVPGVSISECGNYRDHSLFSAQEYARTILGGLERL